MGIETYSISLSSRYYSTASSGGTGATTTDGILNILGTKNYLWNT